jgi:ABC-type bacteriocin/lantibiotic exporter with double-glycine peptidase domain
MSVAPHGASGSAADASSNHQKTEDEEATTKSAPYVDTGLAAFALLAKFLGKAVDPAQLLHERGAGAVAFTVQDMLRAAKRLEIRAREKSVPADKLKDLPAKAAFSFSGKWPNATGSYSVWYRRHWHRHLKS